MEKIAAAGTGGKHTDNIAKNITAILKPENKLPQPFSVQVPYNTKPEMTSINLPHEMFASVYCEYPDAFTRIFHPDTGASIAFWNSQEGHPQMDNRPIKERSDYKEKCTALGMHGDEVPVTEIGKSGCQLFLTFSFFSLLAGAVSTLDSMVWIWGVFEKFILPGEHGTIDIFMSILTWSFYWLWLGKWPTEDWRGNAKLILQITYD